MAYIWLHGRCYKMRRDSSRPQADPFTGSERGQQKSACCVRNDGLGRRPCSGQENAPAKRREISLRIGRAMGQRSLCAGLPFIPQEPAGWRRAHKSEGKENSACCVRSRKTIRDANDANDGWRWQEWGGQPLLTFPPTLAPSTRNF